jgi:hypothetical protein
VKAALRSGNDFGKSAFRIRKLSAAWKLSIRNVYNIVHEGLGYNNPTANAKGYLKSWQDRSASLLGDCVEK